MIWIRLASHVTVYKKYQVRRSFGDSTAARLRHHWKSRWNILIKEQKKSLKFGMKTIVGLTLDRFGVAVKDLEYWFVGDQFIYARYSDGLSCDTTFA